MKAKLDSWVRPCISNAVSDIADDLRCMLVAAVWLRSNASVSIDEVARRQARLLSGWVTLFAPANVPSRYVNNDLGRLRPAFHTSALQ